MGRCLIATDLPLRQPRRVSNFLAGVDSSPRAPSIGPAVLTDELPPQVHPGRALNWVKRGQPLTHGAVLTGGRVTLPWATGGRVERVGSATAFFLHLFRRPAKNAAQHIAQPFCPVAPSVFGSAHGSNHGAKHAREVVKACREFGNVCRA